MSKDTYGFKTIPMNGTIRIDAEADLVQKSAYYWGRKLKCTFTTEMVGTYMEITRHPLLVKGRENLDFSKMVTGDVLNLLCNDLNNDQNYARYHAEQNGIKLEFIRGEDPKGRPMLGILVFYAPPFFRDRTVPHSRKTG